MGYGPTSKMLVNLVDGCAQAKNVALGSVMWTLDGDRTVQTTVVDVTAVKGRQAVDVATDHMIFTAGPDLLLLTPDGWTHAADAAGATVAWTHAKKLCRERPTIRPGYEFGYFAGATCWRAGAPSSPSTIPWTRPSPPGSRSVRSAPAPPSARNPSRSTVTGSNRTPPSW